MSPSDSGDIRRWLVAKGRRGAVTGADPASTVGAPGQRSATEALLPALGEELDRWQGLLWAEGRRSLLVVLQAMDAGGKDGTISHVFHGVNPQGTNVTAFKQPSALELSHDFLWRIHRAVPHSGEIGIFNRSHYEDVLTVRVHGLVPEKVWRPRYDAINAFERQLSETGTTIVKLWLHISSEEQRRRLLARADEPEKRWKLQPADLAERRYWDDYQEAADEMVARTSTSWAPWYVVPANHKWYRNWAVSKILIATLGEMDPKYPPATDLGPALDELRRKKTPGRSRPGP